ncbi:XRE family transcriptional regulator [Streptomyces sp. WAC 06783]|uniref:helix-turn-helix domain-containing protein n=1 Tax=Streptomyces sp. WAC 06783 TaxID=2203211 RepID=UPI000F73E2CC|nr:helix-turn-helix domain-containing protein [Streptomyces sp. WAC 06783]RSO06912.1 XRE family transcriptional regulator [Streptomyces sp. WAC 06783]
MLPTAHQPWAQQIADDLQAQATRLATAQTTGAGLHILLAQAAQLRHEVDFFTAAAVHDARQAGETWEAIAAAADVSVATARARWREVTVRRMLERRARQARPRSAGGVSFRLDPTPGPATSASRAQRPGSLLPPRALAAALSYLQRESKVAIGEAAGQADLSPSYVSRILSGERTPAWPVVHMLATIFNGSAAELRLLWESAQGFGHATRQSLPAAAQRLHEALRGLHLAAARPALADLCATTPLEPALVRDTLSGDHIPDWPTLACLVTQLGAQPAAVKALWEDVHYAVLASRDTFPTTGLNEPLLPQEDPPGTGSTS